MRMSDWSSDVCSSDLAARSGLERGRACASLGGRSAGLGRRAQCVAPRLGDAATRRSRRQRHACATGGCGPCALAAAGRAGQQRIELFCDRIRHDRRCAARRSAGVESACTAAADAGLRQAFRGRRGRDQPARRTDAPAAATVCRLSRCQGRPVVADRITGTGAGAARARQRCRARAYDLGAQWRHRRRTPGGRAGAQDRESTRLPYPSLFLSLRAPRLVGQGCVKHLGDWAAVITLLGVQTRQPLPPYAAYHAAKAGLWSLTESLALELAPRVRVNGVAPGHMIWAISGGIDAERQAAELARIPLGRLGGAEEIARAVRFLWSDDAAYIHGESGPVAGGLRRG